MIAVLLMLLGGEQIPWVDGYAAALERGRAEGRLILVHFQAPGRPLSEVMEKETFVNPRVVRTATKRFVSVRVDGESAPDLLRRLSGSRGGLATCIIDGTEDIVSAMPGFADAEAFLKFLDRARRGYRALRAVREAAEQRPDRATVLFALGEEYASLGSRRRAEACFERAARFGGASRAAAFSHERLARLHALRGKNVEAREGLQEFRKCDVRGREDRASVTEALACALERKPLEALEILSGALRRFPGSPERDQMVLLTGICQHDAGREKQALATLEGLVREFPHSEWLDRARTRIDHIKNPPPGHDHRENE